VGLQRACNTLQGPPAFYQSYPSNFVPPSQETDFTASVVQARAISQDLRHQGQDTPLPVQALQTRSGRHRPGARGE